MEDFFQQIKDVFNWSGWTFALYMVLFSIIVLWLALVFWTFKDARSRMSEKTMIGLATIVALIFPFVGALAYAILRPSESLLDAHERELEIQAMEKELGTKCSCPNCGEAIGDDYLICPSCRTSIRSACAACGRPLETLWRACPYCSYEVNGQGGEPAALEEVTELFGSPS